MKLVLKKALYPSFLSLSILICSVRADEQNSLNEEMEDEILLLSPFTVESSSDVGYLATETLSGTRLRTSMKDIGSSITVATEEFMKDVNATDNESLMVYMAGAEVGGERSISMPNYGGGSFVKNNFGSASSSTRIRGLANADNTLDYFLSDVNWDGYAIDRVDMQRGPNAILFGLGSPAGIINGSLRSARFEENKGHLELQYKTYDSKRISGRYNMVILKDELAVLGAFMNEKRNYRQKPAYDNQDRYYGTVRYEPRWLQFNSSSFRVDVKAETGQSRSNRPRWTPPTDKITQFWASHEQGGLEGETLDNRAAWDSTSYYGLGQAHEKVRDWDYENNSVNWDSEHVNPNWIPSLVGIGTPSPMLIYEDPTSSSQNKYLFQPRMGNGHYWGLDKEGERDGYLTYPTMDFMSFSSYNDFATKAKYIYSESGSYKERSITDPTIFDFYKNLLDGPNKREFEDFDTITGSIRHTFLNNQIGYELSAFKQKRDGGQSSSLGWTSEIAIDFNEYLTDGSPNPNVGRPYVQNDYQYQESRYSSNREAYRASVFAEYDFRNLDNGSWSWLWKSLGKHIFNGAVSQERHWSENFGFSRYAFPRSFSAYQLPSAIDEGRVVSDEDWALRPQAIHYLGGSLLDQNSASGANISRIDAIQRPNSGIYYTFDGRWNAPDSVDPGDVWISPKGEESTQSENPDNYVGWTEMQLDVTDTTEDGTYMSRLNSGNQSIEKVNSETLVWQGKFFDEAFVAMYGWRKDRFRGASKAAPDRVDADGNRIGYKDAYADSYQLPSLDDVDEISGESNSYSFALHVDKLKYMDWMPVQVSVFYNESENFQPLNNRVDIYNRAIPMPQGHTKDTSILIATKNNRLSLRLGKYECNIKNANADILPGAWIITQFYDVGTNSAMNYYYNLDGKGFTIDHQLSPEEQQEAIDNSDGDQWAYASWNMVDRTDEEEDTITAAWWDLIRDTSRVFEAVGMEEMTQALPENGNPQRLSSNMVPGLTYPQDVISRGYEIELSALPFDNWRIRISASKTEAVRSNVGGEALAEWVGIVDKYMEGPAGDMYFWGTQITRNKWNDFRLQYTLAELLDGQTQPDIRKWAFNIVNNYDFREGWLKGTNIGCAYRWRDKSAIGYPFLYGEDGKLTRDAQNPYYGPTEKFVDAWIGYSWTMWDKAWNVRLNVQNLFASDSLIPLNTQPDGSIATYRIPPDRTYQLSLNVDF